MWPKNERRMLLGITGTLALLLVTLTACAEVKVVDKTPVAGTPDLFTSPLGVGVRHNLAVLAVDFDPPLSYQQLIIRRKSVTLLVAVENTGSETERNVTMRAQLSSPENSDFLLTQGASVASIAPGEIKIVRFARLGGIPYHQAYSLEVTVDPVDGEVNLRDNSKAFDIQIQPK